MKRMTVDLDEETFKLLSKKCVDVGRKKADVVRELVRRWILEGCVK